MEAKPTGIREQTTGFAVFGVQSRRSTTMGIFTKDIKTMEDLFLHQLEDILRGTATHDGHSENGGNGDKCGPQGRSQVARD
jgi:hypothetical protein